MSTSLTLMSVGALLVLLAPPATKTLTSMKIMIMMMMNMITVMMMVDKMMMMADLYLHRCVGSPCANGGTCSNQPGAGFQ